MKRSVLPSLRRFAATSLLLLLLAGAGCVSPQTRARERPAAFQQLSPADRQLALSGRIREGFSKDAVYIAWGAPTRIDPGSERREPFDTWVYTQARLGADNGRFGTSMGGLQQYSLDRYGYAVGSIPVGPYLQAVDYSGPEEIYRVARFEHDRVTRYEMVNQRAFSPAADATR